MENYDAGNTCLHCAAAAGHRDVVNQLMDHGGDQLVHMQNKQGFTCLDCNSDEGPVEVSIELVQRGGIDLFISPMDLGESFLHLAIRSRR